MLHQARQWAQHTTNEVFQPSCGISVRFKSLFWDRQTAGLTDTVVYLMCIAVSDSDPDHCSDWDRQTAGLTDTVVYLMCIALFAVSDSDPDHCSDWDRQTAGLTDTVVYLMCIAVDGSDPDHYCEIDRFYWHCGVFSVYCSHWFRSRSLFWDRQIAGLTDTAVCLMCIAVGGPDHQASIRGLVLTTGQHRGPGVLWQRRAQSGGR